jgi:hypothetical protein
VTILTYTDHSPGETLPRDEHARMTRLRDRQILAIQEAVEGLDSALDRDVAKAVEAIRRSGYKDSIIRREIRKLTRRHYDRLGRAVAGQVELAATLADRYSEIRDSAARVHGGFSSNRTMREAVQDARSALAGEALVSRATGQVKARYVGDKLLQTHTKPWAKVRLSKRLHGRSLKAYNEITGQVLAATREAKAMTEAATSLIRVARASSPGEMAENMRKSKMIDRLEKAGNALNKRGDAAALKEWQAARAQLRRQLPKLARSGRTRSSYLELLQRTSETSARGIDRAVQQHAAFRQKYAAERIVKTESAVAFKSRQLLDDAEEAPYIVAYIWRLNRASRRGFVRRTGPRAKFSPRKSARRRRCICEELDGRRISVEMAKAHPSGHPHCMCWLEPVMDPRLMRRATVEELARA